MKALGLAALLLLTSDAFGQTQSLQLHLSKRVCQAPCAVDATVTVAPHPLNRWFVVQLESDVFSQGSMRPLEGNKSKPTQPPIPFVKLPPGHYTVIAVLYRAEKKSEASRISTSLLVVGGDSS
jgi:hypothetical protein